MRNRMRDVRAIGRARPTRTPKRSILIVCEGERTEPNYLSFFKKELRLSNVAVEICGSECGSDPLSVVEYGEKRFRKDRSIDDCFCVIDRDAHAIQRYNAAKIKAQALDDREKKRDFVLFVSDPCIEYWFLLHFEYCRIPFMANGKKSRAEAALDRLKIHLPDYAKSMPDLGSVLAPRLDTACNHARRAMQDAKETDEPNPSTDLHDLITKLRGR